VASSSRGALASRSWSPEVMSGQVGQGSELSRWPRISEATSQAAAQHGLAIVMVGAATAVGFAMRDLVTAPSLTLFYVLPVVAAAVSFGWAPSLTATVLGVLAYDFFFTRPFYSLAIESRTDVGNTALLLVIAAFVSTMAAQSRRRARASTSAAEQAEALQALAQTVIQSRPFGEVAQAAARALNRMFGAPSIVLTEREAALHLAGKAGVEIVGDADWVAAIASVSARVPTRGGAYPTEDARFDFWPFASPAGAIVVGLDLSDADEDPQPAGRMVELVGGYLTASASATGRVAG
jgi:two-component system sensor histidine kinase KdpD